MLKRFMVRGSLLGCLLLLSPGCQETPAVTETEAGGDGQTTQPDQADDVTAASVKGGAQVWAENCMRCHNYRQPRGRSDREWEAIVHHMRVRANLTAEEHRLILRFLKSAN